MIQEQTKTWWKVACRIARRFDDSPASSQANNSNRIRDSALQLQKRFRMLDEATRRRWQGAAGTLTHDCQQVIAQTIKVLEETRQSIVDATANHEVQAKEVFRDLVALSQEFDELRFDSKDRKLLVETESIRLDGLDLGRFKIELDVESLSSKNNAYYEFIALDPNPAESNDNTVHPHVDANRLCEGEAQSTIRLALRQGRLLDFFQIVRQVLGSYNPSSAYTKIADWSGRACNHCGYTTDPDDTCDCRCCETNVCVDCTCSCCNCDRDFCGNCHDPCTDCYEPVCESCRVACEDCSESFCPQCTTKNKRCETCEEKSEEDSNTGADQTDVHADSLGKTAVPP